MAIEPCDSSDSNSVVGCAAMKEKLDGRRRGRSSKAEPLPSSADNIKKSNGDIDQGANENPLCSVIKLYLGSGLMVASLWLLMFYFYN